MYQAIQAKYYGPTNFRGARIKVWAQAGVRWYPYQYEQSDGGKAACISDYAGKLDWKGTIHYGELADGSTVGVLEY